MTEADVTVAAVAGGAGAAADEDGVLELLDTAATAAEVELTGMVDDEAAEAQAGSATTSRAAPAAVISRTEFRRMGETVRREPENDEGPARWADPSSRRTEATTDLRSVHA